MTLGKITTDNIVKYTTQSEPTKERDNKPRTMKSDSLPRKQNRKISRNIRKFIKNIATE